MDSSRRLLIIAGGVLVVLIMIVLVVLSLRGGNDGEGGLFKDYFDPNSGETVSEISDVTPEKFGAPNDELLYLGVADLLDHGISSGQLESVKYAFYRYARPKKIIEISVKVDSITTKPRNSDTGGSKSIVTFDLTADRKTSLKATLESDIITKRIRLRLTNSSGSNVYDSGSLAPNKKI